MDRELSEDEWEDVNQAEGGVASDNVLKPHAPLNESTMTDYTLVVVPPDQPLDPLPDGTVFLRAGERARQGHAGALPHPMPRSLVRENG